MENEESPKISLTEAARIARGDLKPPTVPIRFDGKPDAVAPVKSNHCPTCGLFVCAHYDHLSPLPKDTLGWCSSCDKVIQPEEFVQAFNRPDSRPACPDCGDWLVFAETEED